MKHSTIVMCKPSKKRTKAAHNPPAPELGPARRQDWAELYKTTCGPERATRRKSARDTNTEIRTAVAIASKADRAAARAAEKIAEKAAREAAAARARPKKRRSKLELETRANMDEADRLCNDARRKLLERTEADKRRRSEARTPKQREAARRTLERLHEQIESEATAVEAEVNARGGLGAMARKEFIRHGASYIAAARARTKKHPRNPTQPYELFLEHYEENRDTLDARWFAKLEGRASSEAEHYREQERQAVEAFELAQLEEQAAERLELEELAIRRRR